MLSLLDPLLSNHQYLKMVINAITMVINAIKMVIDASNLCLLTSRPDNFVSFLSYFLFLCADLGFLALFRAIV